MKLNGYNKIFICASLAFLSLIVKVTAQKNTAGKNSLQALETGFIKIPDSIQTTVYWYWLSDNISEQGVINDLEAMKKVGINRAFIGNIGMQGVPYGKVKIFSDEWWNIMHAALKAATRLNIEIGIFNSPGWSQSGGPWVKPEQSMRYLTSTEVKIKGPALIDRQLEKPAKYFQDVKLIAYPVSEDIDKSIIDLKPEITSVPERKNLNEAFDNNNSTGIEIQNGKKLSIDINTKENYSVASFVIYPLHSGLKLEGDVQIKTDTGYRTIKHFYVDHSNTELNVGFKPFGPAAFSFPATTSKNFRILLSPLGDGNIAEIKLSATAVVENYIDKTLAKMWQTPLPYWDAYQWPSQPIADKKYVIDPDKVIDISRFMSADGKLKWNVPNGNWIIERCGMTSTGVTNGPASPEGTGPETDKMSREHIEAHFNAFLGEIIKRIPAADRKTWKVVVADSYETGSQNWTDQQTEKFKKVYGYDPTSYLPVLQGKVVGSEDKSDRFLWDLRRFVADNVAYQYVGGLRDISHKNGLHTWLECYGHWGFPAEFLQYGGQSDEVGGEFWSFGDLGNIENRDASSCAHIYGKTKVSAESFTGGDPAFSRYPAMLKQRADRFFTEGINNTLMHVYISQPDDKKPGVNTWFGNEFNRNNTWFYDMDIFLQYIKRCNFMLQQGKYVADVAYFIGEDAPKMTGVQDPALPKGYSFDYMNAEVIKNRMSVQNGKLMLPDGMQYRILVLPQLTTMRPELLLKIKALVNQGAIVLGPRPTVSPSLQDFGKADKIVQKIADELWGKINGTSIKINHVGKGMMIDGMDLQQALNMINVIPDFTTDNNESVLFLHRTTTDGDIYFLSNQTSSPIKFDAQFRIKNKLPEIWDAVSGKTRLLPDYHLTDSSTLIPIELDALGSSFIVFKKNIRTASKPNYPLPLETKIIAGPWSVQFDNNMRGPKAPVIFNTLSDWTQNINDSIKYFSGSAFYSTNFIVDDLEKDQTVLLDLGDMKAIAKVLVNGQDVGGAWIAPFKIDISKALKTGNNSLVVKVTNTWVNRLIGDAKLPESERKTWLYNNPYKADSKLLPSGLLGPVKLEIMKY